MAETTPRVTLPRQDIARRRKLAVKLEHAFLLCALVFSLFGVLGPWIYGKQERRQHQQPQHQEQQLQQQQQQQLLEAVVSATTSTSNKPSARELNHREDVFGACLMFKDDLASLPEFLAYHYTVLPLRFLFLGTDVGNEQDPLPVLEKWSQRTALEYHHIQVGNLTDDTALHQRHTDVLDAHHAFVNRQRLFVRACVRQMKAWNVHWTAFTDSDEYVTYIYDEDYQRNTTLAQKLQEWQTAGELINRVCYTMPRLRYGSLETIQCPVTTKTVQGRGAFASLTTQRFVQHAHPDDFKVNRFGKVLMNVSAISIDVAEGGKGPHVNNIHRPYTEYCARSTEVKAARLRVNHYVGSLDKFLGRADDVRRTVDKYRELSAHDHNHSCSDRNMHTWVNRFVEQMSLGTAEELLQI